MKTRSPWIVIPTLVALAGCGGDGGPGGSGVFPSTDRTGDGSGTLEVEARIEASPVSGETAGDRDALVTDFEVGVRDASGADVAGAAVIVDSPLGPVTLREGGCERRYCGTQNGYADVYAISVTRDSDFLDDVVVHGPSFHRIDSPEPGATVDATVPLEIRWSPSGEADEVEVKTREMERTLAGDPGRFEVPAGTLRTRDDEPEEERIRVRRKRRLGLTGGLGSSDVVVEVRNGVEVFTMPVPSR